MSDHSGFVRETHPSDIIISERVSEDEEPTDEEYVDSSERLEGGATGLISRSNLDRECSPRPSAQVETEVESLGATEDLQTEKACDVLDYFSRDAHSSSDEPKSVESSTDSSYIIEYQGGNEGDGDFVHVEVVDEIEEDVANLMEKCREDYYSAKHSEVDLMLAKCKKLFERDYICKVIDNSEGSLCAHYPVRLIIPVAEKSETAGSERLDAEEFDAELYTQQIKSSTICRPGKRFVAPVMMLNSKVFICRAGTITVRITTVFEKPNKTSPIRTQSIKESPVERTERNIARAFADASSRSSEAVSPLFVPTSIRKLLDIDAQIMKTLRIQYICDLMTEDRNKWKHTRFSSLKKINLDIYRDCKVQRMPYPGCQFFKRYHAANHNPEGLIFEWRHQAAVNTELILTKYPTDSFDPKVGTYWDVVDLTKNYMKVLLLYLTSGSGGLLVHSISGSDSTPLFVSLLRISLWADKVIHTSLDYKEMAYLTLAYDWYLFGHNLPSRLKRKEEIMHFCFKFLPCISSDDFSLTRMFQDFCPEGSEGLSLPVFVSGRRSILEELSSYVLRIYDEFLTERVGRV